VNVEAIHQDTDIPDRIELPFYRVIQESMTNSLRHGGAQRITVRLWREVTRIPRNTPATGMAGRARSRAAGLAKLAKKPTAKPRA